MENYIDRNILANFLNNRTPYPVIQRFPKEFKKNWLESIDFRFLLILVINFIITISLVLYFYPHELNQTNTIDINRLQENYARLLIQDKPNYLSEDFSKLEEKTKKNYFYSVSEETKETQTGEIEQKALPSSFASIEKNLSKPLAFYNETRIERHSKVRKNNLTTDVGSIGLLKLITSDSRLADNPISDILEITGESSLASLSNLDGLTIARQSSDLISEEESDNDYKIRGAKFEKVTLKDVMNSLSSKEKLVSNIISKNVDWEEIPVSNLTKSNKKKGSNGVSRSPEEITRILMSHNRSIQDCYKQVLKRNPELKGKIVVRFLVNPDGEVSHVNIISSTINDDEMKKCIINKIRRWNDFGSCNPEIGDLYYRQTYIFGF